MEPRTIKLAKWLGKKFGEYFGIAMKDSVEISYPEFKKALAAESIPIDSWQILNDASLMAETVGINLVEGLQKSLEKAHNILVTQSGKLYFKTFAKADLEMSKTLEQVRKFIPEEQFKFLREALRFQQKEEQFAPIMRDLEKYYQTMGKLDQDYFKQREARIKEDHRLRTQRFTAAGIVDPEGKSAEIAQQEMWKFIQDSMKNRITIHKEAYDKLGIMTDTYYDSIRVKTEHHYDMLEGLIEPALLKRLRDKAKFNDDMKKLFADEVKVSANAIKMMEKTFKETGIMSEKLLQVRQAQINEEQKRLIEIDPQLAETILLQRNLELFKDQNKAKIDIQKQYFKESKIMTQALYDYEKQMIEDQIKALTKTDPNIAEQIKNKRIQVLDNKFIQAKLNAYRAMNSKLGGMSQAHYDMEVGLLEQTRDNMIEITGDVDRAVEAFKRSLGQIKVQQLLGTEDASAGLEAFIIDLEAKNKTAAQAFYDNWSTIVDGTKDTLSTGFFDFMNAEFTTVWDLFEKTGMNFKNMIDKMVSDYLAAQLMKQLFGTLADSSASGTGVLGEIVQGIAGLFGSTAAKGAVFPQGGVAQFYRGGTVKDATMFAYAGGTKIGVMGERGDEAIMPLARNQQGELGVKSTSAGSTINNLHIKIEAPNGRIEQQSLNQLQTRVGTTMQRTMRRNL